MRENERREHAGGTKAEGFVDLIDRGPGDAVDMEVGVRFLGRRVHRDTLRICARGCVVGALHQRAVAVNVVVNRSVCCQMGR